MRLNDRCVFSILIVVVFLTLADASSISGQQKPPAKANCPATKVSCPDQVNVKDSLTFTANVSGGDSNVTPTYNWTVSAGTISSGQGTSTIEVDTAGMEGDSTVTATVDVGGFDRSCGYGATTNSCTTSVAKKAEARKLDEYGKLRPQDENARLDNFMIQLMNDPTAQGHIISYNARAGRPGAAQKAADRIKTYLTTKRRLDKSRLVTVTGGSREEPTIELWIVPSGAELPKPTPSAKPAASKPTTRSVKPAASKPKTPAKPTNPKPSGLFMVARRSRR